METSERARSLYTEVGDDGQVLLDAGHPGFADAAYRARRNELAALSIGWKPGTPVPHAAYTPAEDALWATVSNDLAPLLERRGADCIRAAVPLVGLPRDRVPQLDEVTAALAPITGFAYGVVAGLAELREFYGALADGLFLSTQYLRHPSVPLYTPEPDVIHEVIGHGLTLAVPELAEICRAMGRAVRRVETADALEALSRVFWFSLEFGAVWEYGEPRAYGAGILSSSGELTAFQTAQIRPLDVAAMATQSYDITRYQPVIFAGSGLREIVDVVGGLFDEADDDTMLALTTGNR